MDCQSILQANRLKRLGYLVLMPVRKKTKKSDIDILVNFSPESKVTLFKYIHIINDLQALTGKRIDLVEDGQIKQFAESNAENDKILIYERKAKG
jgi:uncharacterized protein